MLHIFKTARRTTTREREKIALLILPDFSLLFSLLFVGLLVACLLLLLFFYRCVFPLLSYIYSSRVSKEGMCDLLSDCLFPFLCFPGIVCDQDIDRIRSSFEKGKSWRGLLNQKETSILQQNHTTGWSHCAVFLGKTLYYHIASLPRPQAVSLFFENPGEEHKVSARSWLLAWHANGKRWRREPLVARPSAASPSHVTLAHPARTLVLCSRIFEEKRNCSQSTLHPLVGWGRSCDLNNKIVILVFK